MHPLVEAARRTSQAEDQLAWAQAAADRIEPRVTEALACTEPTDRARELLALAVRTLYAETVPYTGVPPAPAWIEATHHKLYARARELFGADGWRAVPAPHHEPLPARPAGPRSMFGV